MTAVRGGARKLGDRSRSSSFMKQQSRSGTSFMNESMFNTRKELQSSSRIDSHAYRIQGVQSVNQRGWIQQSDCQKAKVMTADSAMRTRGKAGQGNAMQDI